MKWSDKLCHTPAERSEAMAQTFVDCCASNNSQTEGTLQRCSKKTRYSGKPAFASAGLKPHSAKAPYQQS